MLAQLAQRLEAVAPPSEEPPVYLWPDNVAAWEAFIDLQTQWRVGFNGRTGLDYAAVLAHLRAVVADDAERADIYAGVRACEGGALEAWAKAREQ
jgi:hypothetical protein